MGFVKWCEKTDKYTLDMMRTGILDIPKVSSEFGIANSLVRKYAPKIAKFNQLVILGITKSLTPTVMTIEQYKESKRLSKKSTIHKDGEVISSEKRIVPKGKSKFMCNVNLEDSKAFMIILSSSKKSAKEDIMNMYSSILSVNYVMTMQEHRDSMKNSPTMVTSRGSGSVKSFKMK